nr:hypothetical protein [Tanacetum cinerariifolium]
MSFGSHPVRGTIVANFDMHTFTSTMTVDEVNTMVEQCDIPPGLRPRVPSSTMTINNTDVIGITIPTYRTSLPSRFQAEDVRLLCENVIDLRDVHASMLYEIGLTTIWKHVRCHSTFKDGEGNVAVSMCKFLKFPMASGVRIGRGTALRVNKVIIQHDPTASEAQDKMASKRHAPRGPSCRTKKKNTTPLTLALSDSEGDESQQSGSKTIHSVTPITIVAPQNENVEAGGSNQALQSDEHVEEEVANASDNNDNRDNEVNSPKSAPSPHSKHSLHFEERIEIRSSANDMHITSWIFGSSSVGSGRHTFPSQNSMVTKADPSGLISPHTFYSFLGLDHQIDPERCQAWFELEDGSLARADLLQRYEALNDDYGELYQTHASCKDISQRLTGTQNELVDALRT